MKRVILSNFRSENRDRLRHKNIDELNPGDLVYFVNGMNDVAICSFISYKVDNDRKGHTIYEIDGEVVTPLNKYYKKGQITNMFTYSNTVEIYL